MPREAPFIFILLIMQPVTDLLTGQFASHLTNIITIGMIYRILLIVLILFYLGKYFGQQHLKLFGLLLVTLFSVCLTFFSNFFIKESFLFFQEAQFLFKTIFYICATYITYALIKQQTLSQQFIFFAATAMAVIVSGSYWLALITDTSLATYSVSNAGYTGWFFAPNELSVTIILLFALASAHLLRQDDPDIGHGSKLGVKYLSNKKHSLILWGAFFSLLFIGPVIGTKTAFLGNIIILLACVFGVFFKQNKFWQHRRYPEILVGITFIFFITIPWTPITKNLSDQSIASSQIQQLTSQHDPDQLPGFLQRLLSSRDYYFLDIYMDYKQAHLFQKTFGLGYAGNYIHHPKIIEMDFFDMFFSYGFIGTLLLLTPLLLIVWEIIKQWRSVRPPLQVIILTLGVCLATGIAFLAGHVIFAPSVITYVMLTFLAIGLNRVSYGNNNFQ